MMYATAKEARIADAKREANRILNAMARMPSMVCTANSREVVRQIMLQTGGRMLACGYDHDVISRSLGGGVYRVTLRRT